MASGPVPSYGRLVWAGASVSKGVPGCTAVGARPS
jgi:hypothetical protein